MEVADLKERKKEKETSTSKVLGLNFFFFGIIIVEIKILSEIRVTPIKITGKKHLKINASYFGQSKIL